VVLWVRLLLAQKKMKTEKERENEKGRKEEKKKNLGNLDIENYKIVILMERLS
jgi:hypothetical protein